MSKLTKAEKQEQKFIKQQDREFRRLYRKIVRKLKKAVMHKDMRFKLLQDLEKCNNIEIVHYLATQAEFSNDKEYVSLVNKWLLMETITYKYPFELVYEVGNMENITKAITLFHRKLDLEKDIFGNEDN